MARNVIDVLVGNGALFSASTGTAFPSPPEGSIDGATEPTNFTEVGYSEEGWSFQIDRTFEDIFVEEEVDPIATYKTAQNITLVGQLAQATLESVELALGGGTISAGVPANHDTYAPPSSSATPDELALVLAVPTSPVGGSPKVRYFHIPRAIATGAVQMTHQKAPQKVLVAVEFRLLIPSSGDIFTVIEQVT